VQGVVGSNPAAPTNKKFSEIEELELNFKIAKNLKNDFLDIRSIAKRMGLHLWAN
jgi:hypothetical protein